MESPHVFAYLLSVLHPLSITITVQTIFLIHYYCLLNYVTFNVKTLLLWREGICPYYMTKTQGQYQVGRKRSDSNHFFTDWSFITDYFWLLHNGKLLGKYLLTSYFFPRKTTLWLRDFKRSWDYINNNTFFSTVMQTLYFDLFHNQLSCTLSHSCISTPFLRK